MFIYGKEFLITLLCGVSLLLNAVLIVSLRRKARERQPAWGEEWRRAGSGDRILEPAREGGPGTTAAASARGGETETEDSCQRFLPAEILKLLGRKSYSQLSVGDQQYSSAAIMEVNTAGFQAFVHDKQPDAVFTYINNMLNRIIPIVYENDGVVEGFAEGGLTAFYRENRERAVVAAVSVCETMERMSRENPEYQAVTVGLCYGQLMVGAVGHDRRMTILILSEAREFARFLQSMGPKYYARIIVTAGFLEAIPDWGKKFNYRLLGYVYLHTSRTVEKIYDVFDGDSVEVRNRKRKTKMVFEKGVALFMERRTAEARQHFIEVMKMDHGDKAAKEYLLRCDQALNGEAGGDIFIESY